MKCAVCNAPSERHHLKTRGSGGTDDDWNILLLCRIHHVECHQLGLKRFTSKYPSARILIEKKGWEYDEVCKWTNRNQ